MAISGIFKKKDTSFKEKSKAIPFNIEAWHYRRFSGELLDIDTIVACIDALARNLAKMRLTAIRRDKDQIAVTDFTSDIARVLKQPNKYMTQYDFIYKIAGMYYVSNNVYIWPEYNNKGELINLWPINYRTAKIYEYDDVELIKFELKKNHYYTIPYSQIIHLRNQYIEDELYGDSNDAFKAIADLMDAQNQGIKGGIKNSALIRGILKALQVMKEEDIKAARDRFLEDNFNVQNNGGIMLVDGKFDYTPIESKPYVVDADTRKETREAAYSYFGVNEDFIQNKFTSEKYEAIYEGRLEPFAVMLTDALTKHLFTERERSFGNQIEANMSKLKYQPLSQVTSMISATRELGLFTRDEYREMLGYEPLGPERGGDEIMIAVNNYDSSTNDDSSDESADQVGSENSDIQEGEEDERYGNKNILRKR